MNAYQQLAKELGEQENSMFLFEHAYGPVFFQGDMPAVWVRHGHPSSDSDTVYTILSTLTPERTVQVVLASGLFQGEFNARPGGS